MLLHDGDYASMGLLDSTGMFTWLIILGGWALWDMCCFKQSEVHAINCTGLLVQSVQNRPVSPYLAMLVTSMVWGTPDLLCQNK